MKSVQLLPLTMVLALAACGDTAPLRPAAGQPLPVKPAMAPTTPDADALLAATPMAHPQRVDELMKRSEPRRADRFDLPPPDGAAAPIDPGTNASAEEEATRVGEPK